MAADDIDIVEMVEFPGVFVDGRIGIIDAVDAVFAHEDSVGFDFRRPQGGRRIRRELRIAGPGRENDDTGLFQMTDGTAPDIGLGNLPHFNGGLDPSRHA